MSIKMKCTGLFALSAVIPAIAGGFAAGEASGSVWGLSFGFAAIGVGVSWALFGGLVSNSIDEFKRSVDNLATGRGTLSEPEDTELADLAKSVGKVMNNHSERSSEISGCMDRVSVLCKEFTGRVRPQGSSQLREVEQVVDAINTMTSTVNEVADNANTAARAARDANTEADSGQKVVDDVTQSIHSLADEVERAANAIQKLEADSESIGAILEVIRGIADQTNLLALNAAIEAARAGEQGRGFAVVADEVRTLAQRTQEATEEINDMIARLQEGSSNAVKVMAEGRKQAERSVEQASKAGESLSAITAAISSISEMNEQIAGAVESQTSAASSISYNLDQIRNGSEKEAEMSHDSDRLISELDNAVSELGQVVNR